MTGPPMDKIVPPNDYEDLIRLIHDRFEGLCCTNPVRDSSCDSSVVAGGHEQTHIPRLQDQELAGLQ